MTDRAAARRGAGLVVFCALAVGCAQTSGAPDPSDPWERMNRGTFAFNEAADRWVIAPAARGWDFVVPDFAQTGLANLFENMRMPRYVLNNVLQGRPDHALIEVFRFTFNVMLGFGGFVDVAGRADWPHFAEDFDLTMGHWGVETGPYLVLPIFGASTVRGTGGRIVDSFSTSPYTYLVPFYVPFATMVVESVNDRTIYWEEIEQSRQEALDFYLFVRSAYLQNREHRLRGGAGDGRSRPFGAGAAEDDDEEEDLYYFDDEFDDDLEDADRNGEQGEEEIDE